MRKNHLKSKSFVLLICALSIYMGSTHPAKSTEKLRCNTEAVELFLEHSRLKKLEIRTNKTRKWAKNYLKILTDERENIQPSRKKKFNATILANFENGLACSFKAKIRVNGDWKDHLKNAPSLVTSLDVKLLTGNINTVIKFKLLLPHTRNGDNEIFVTTFLKLAGFISPKTFYVPTTFNGVQYRYLFQEKSAKELIESYRLREGPILEGDERFIWSVKRGNAFDEQLGLARIINKNWAKKGRISTVISQRSLGILNTAYLKYLIANFSKKSISEPTIVRGKYLNAEVLGNGNYYSKKLNQEYRSFLVALRATHASRPHNRSFYYDTMYKYFLPIYYDGNSDILNPKSSEIQTMFGELDLDEVSGAADALSTLKEIDKKDLYNKLNEFGVNISRTKISSILEMIKDNLVEISKSKVESHEEIYYPYFSDLKDAKKLLVFTGQDWLEVEVCNFSLTDCYKRNFDIDEYSSLLNGRFNKEDGREYIFLGISKVSYITDGKKFDLNNKTRRIFSAKNGVSIIASETMHVEIDHTKNSIYFAQRKLTDRALIVGGNLNRWKVKFKGISHQNEPNSQRFNDDLLTGCLTFLDINLYDLDVEVINSSCEDAVNFLRTKGMINTIVVANTNSDAIDIDYSRVRILDIKVTEAGNDCVDLSAGKYDIGNAMLISCGDKGISVGEGSRLDLNTASIRGTNVGIAVKDSSHMSIKRLTTIKVPICLSAYRKKQEYWGGKIKVGTLDCSSQIIDQQEGSRIEFEK